MPRKTNYQTFYPTQFPSLLDPFMGSGTTAMVAKSLGRDYIGCELHEDYGSLIQKRVQDYVPQKEVSQEPCINLLDIL